MCFLKLYKYLIIYYITNNINIYNNKKYILHQLTLLMIPDQHLYIYIFKINLIIQPIYHLQILYIIILRQLRNHPISTTIQIYE